MLIYCTQTLAILIGILFGELFYQIHGRYRWNFMKTLLLNFKIENVILPRRISFTRLFLVIW